MTEADAGGGRRGPTRRHKPTFIKVHNSNIMSALGGRGHHLREQLPRLSLVFSFGRDKCRLNHTVVSALNNPRSWGGRGGEVFCWSAQTRLGVRHWQTYSPTLLYYTIQTPASVKLCNITKPLGCGIRCTTRTHYIPLMRCTCEMKKSTKYSMVMHMLVE